MNFNTRNIFLRYFILSVISLLLGCNSATQTGTDPVTLVIRNINVVDVLTGNLLPNQDVAVKNQVIYFIGESISENIPNDAVIINGNGKYLCPSLWDMHFHLCWDKGNDTLLFSLLLANGITGIRDMGGDLSIMRGFKKNVSAGKTTGPEIFGSGPMIDGNPPVYREFSLPVDDQTNMPYALDSLKNNGADYFKTYSLLQEAQLKQLAAYCTAHNMHFAGHLSEHIETEIAIILGQKSIEHLNRLDEIWQTDKPRMDSIARLMITNNTALCPTLITYQLKTKVRDTSIVNKDYTQYIPASLTEEWKATWEKRRKRHTRIGDWERLDTIFIGQMELVRRLHAMGVMILAGSDFAGMPYVYPGIGLHQEIRLLVQAGLSNNEALKAATINPAIYLNKQHITGSVSSGKYADMLILEKNPLENVDNLRSIKNVIVKGKIVVNNN
jgi:imidazolonepropionase-like amidohydrolase